MSEQPPEVWVETSDNPTLQEFAERVGEPSEWGRPETIPEVLSRLCDQMGTSRITDEIRTAAIEESDRQHALFSGHEQELRKQAEDIELRSRMGSIATGLVNALVPENDPRNREAIVTEVLEALRPLDERLKHTEWDGIIR